MSEHEATPFPDLRTTIHSNLPAFWDSTSNVVNAATLTCRHGSPQVPDESEPAHGIRCPKSSLLTLTRKRGFWNSPDPPHFCPSPSVADLSRNGTTGGKGRNAPIPNLTTGERLVRCRPVGKHALLGEQQHEPHLRVAVGQRTQHPSCSASSLCQTLPAPPPRRSGHRRLGPMHKPLIKGSRDQKNRPGGPEADGVVVVDGLALTAIRRAAVLCDAAPRPAA